MGAIDAEQVVAGGASNAPELKRYMPNKIQEKLNA